MPYKAPTGKAWLDKHPRFHMHYTPTYSSWINQVERWFAELTRQLIERGDHRNVQTLAARAPDLVCRTGIPAGVCPRCRVRSSRPGFR